MEEYFLIDNFNCKNEHGMICKTVESDIVDYEQPHKKINDIDKNYCISLNEVEVKYFAKIDKKERILHYKKGLFNKIQNLQVNDECHIKTYDDQNIYGKIKSKSVLNNEIYIELKPKSGTTCRLRPSSIIDIEIVKTCQTLIEDGYYIVIDKFSVNNTGTILCVGNGIIKTMNDGIEIDYQDNMKDKVMKIQNDEAQFLLKFTIEERMDKFENNIFKKIKNLTIGDECYCKKDIGKVYSVKKKNFELCEIKFGLKSKHGKNFNEVDASEIELIQKKRPILDKLRGGKKHENNSHFNRQDSTNSGTSNDSKDTAKNNETILTSISYESIKFKCIIPKSLIVIDKDNIPSERFIIMQIQNKPVYAKLFWKGLVHHQICIGCDLLFDDRTFNSESLFKNKKNGILIPINENIKTCESENSTTHYPIDENKIIDENCICCLEIVEPVTFMNIKINDTIIYGKDKIKGICKWFLLVNGEKCVGIVTSDCYNERFFKNNGLIHRIETFSNQRVKLLIFQIKDILSTIFYEPIRINIINPNFITEMNKGNSVICNKLIVIKNDVVKLLWKGSIKDQICLGCELLSDSNYGTNGSFNKVQLFTCKDKRGVLIPMNDDIETCESKNLHSSIGENEIIKENCICCIESIEKSKFRDIEIGSNLIWLKKLRGKCIWLGYINGLECTGIQCDDYTTSKIYKSGGLLYKTNLFEKDMGKLAVVDIGNTEIEKPHFIVDKIVDTTQIYSVKSLTTPDKISIGVPVKLSITLQSTVEVVGEVKWIGIINNEKCVGLDMENKFDFGMNGYINENNNFSCFPGHGLITLLKNVKLFEYADKLCTFENGFIHPSKFLKCEDKTNYLFLNSKLIKKDDMVLVRLTDGEIKVKGKLKWCGLMNKLPVCAVELTDEHENGSNGMFWRRQLFSCHGKRAIATQQNNILNYVQISFVKEVFVENNHKFSISDMVDKDNTYKIGQFIEISSPKLYGVIDCFFIKYGEELLKIKVETALIDELDCFTKIVYPSTDANYSNIVVQKKFVKKISEITSFENHPLIDPMCIKYKTLNQFKHYQKKEIVKFKDASIVKYFFVENYFIIHGVHCLEVKEAILGLKTKYVRVIDVCEIDTSELEMKYFQGVFIDPNSIISLEKFAIDDLKEGDKVQFKLKDSYASLEGIIKFTVRTNKILSSVVQLTSKYDGERMFQYTINEKSKFLSLWENSELPMFIIPAYILKKQDCYEMANGISVINPHSIKKKEGKKCQERYIIFKCNNKKHFAILKWKGDIDTKYCLGCEIQQETELGTNGTFGKESLFICRDKCGILIPIDAVTDCCEKIEHFTIKEIKDKKIDENRICCIEYKENINQRFKINVDDRVKRKHSKDCATCKWIGLVNDVEAIGVELKTENGNNGTFCGIKLFNCRSNFGALFKLSEYISARSELKYLDNMDLYALDPFNVKVPENGKSLEKLTHYKCKEGNKLINIKWRGIIDGDLCVGCELASDTEFGTNGTFATKELFKCANRRGVLIPVYDELKESCEAKSHLDIVKFTDGIFLNKEIHSINPDFICCVEIVSNIKKWPEMCIGSTIKYTKGNKSFSGICKWIGLINDKEAVGVAMDYDVKGSNGLFNSFKLFTCEIGRGFLFLADDIIHDIENEKLHFLFDKVVDTNNHFSVKLMRHHVENGISIGVPVLMIMTLNGIEQDYIGEVKWIGMINNKKCVGLDMEDVFDFGMNGIIDQSNKFECMDKHGLVTLLSNVELYQDAEKPPFLDTGIINPNKFLKCISAKILEEKEFLKERKVKKNEFVFIKLNYGENKMKGILRWCGFMNKLSICAVELNEDHENGTDGRFWRHRLFECHGKRAIATMWNNIYEYKPFEKMNIPEESRLIKDIDINSAVKYYLNDVKELYGTVRWTGLNDKDEYVFGIELDDRLSTGTNGEFYGQQLFHCQNGHGVLAPINYVTKDIRFMDADVSPDAVLKSEECESTQYGIIAKLKDGENKGIQGNANSCYFDSAIFALFSKSDVLDFMISPLMIPNETDTTTKEFRSIMTWKIVYPLRKFGFVSFHRTNEMRNLIQNYGPKFAEMTKQETDMENVSALLSKLCPEEQLLSIISHNNIKTNSMFLQLFLTVEQKVPFMTSEEMLKISMVQNDIMFNELPTCLIMQAPRDARGTNCYENAIPSKIIEISDVCSNNFKICCQCKEEAIYQCKKCIRKTLNIAYSFHCLDHKCEHMESVKLPNCEIRSKSKVFMELQSIICIEKCHFVSYVKQIDKETQWFFFDSMNSQSTKNNYAVPRVSHSQKVSEFLNLSEQEMKEDINSYDFSDLKRIVKDSYIFIYHNYSKTCY